MSQLKDLSDKYKELKPLSNKVSLAKSDDIITMTATKIKKHSGAEDGTENLSFSLAELTADRDRLQAIVNEMTTLITDSTNA